VQLEQVGKSNPHACDNIPRLREFHSIHVFCPYDPTRFMVKPLAYFYVTYLESEWHNCGNQSHVQQWRLIKLQPKDTQFVCGNMEEDGDLRVDGPIDGESLGDLF
jgi:hypothetical protein